MADKAYRVGGNPSSQSYLNRNKILEIAKDSNCEALHPGFGFLSENAHFAQECVDHGVRFIGPPPSAITAMGSKSESKKIMTGAGVPVVPGYHGDEQAPSHLFQQANQMQYPVLIKAVSGGGGKGMRIVRRKEDFLQALESCKREALKAFSDDRVLVEKYITKPRHIEVQVFGDQHGNYVHLYERDCSIQRRHQKVVEQAPSNVADNIRELICRSAVEAARAVGYYNAGTVEFIFDLDSNKHYFMEMNTRLQVQHPISEMITGYDFVEWQLLVASGFPLPKKQSEINKKGNAIEVRIYAEDPFNGFLPGNGKLKYLREPAEHGGVRIQTGVRDKDVISTYYDPMISKLITYGATRAEAIELMKQALKDYRIVGLNNNLKFLKRVFDNAVFRQGDYDTGFIEQNIDALLKKETDVDPYDLVTAVIARSVTNGAKLGLPAELVDFKNVKGQKLIQRLSVTETSLAKELKWDV